MTIFIPGDGSALRGVVPVTITAAPTKNLQRVEFYVDGMIKGSRTSSPAGFDWNTGAIADGKHTLRGDAVYKSRTSTASISVTVVNSAQPVPPPNSAISAPTAVVT